MRSQYVKRTVKLLKYSLQLSLHSSRIFSAAIFTDNEKLNKAQKRSRLCQSRLSFSIPVVFPKREDTKIPLKHVSVSKLSAPAYMFFPLRVLFKIFQ